MDCTRCTAKGCRISEPCSDRSSEYIDQYNTEEAQSITRAASKLVDGGRAGSLSRLEEIVEYARLEDYRMLGVAYCYGMEDLFLENMDSSFHLISWDKLQEILKQETWQKEVSLIDLRSETAFHENGIDGSIQCLLAELPSNYKTLLPEQSMEVIIYCNGGMQSLYAVMYLSMKGYRNVKSLAGGFANYLEKTGH